MQALSKQFIEILIYNHSSCYRHKPEWKLLCNKYTHLNCGLKLD